MEDAVRSVKVSAGVLCSVSRPRPGGSRSVGIEEYRKSTGRKGAVVAKRVTVDSSQGEGLAYGCGESIRVACKGVRYAIVASVITSGAALFQKRRVVHPIHCT